MTHGSTTLLAHEWLEKTGGSENTFEQMIRVVPDARVACLWNNAPDRFPSAEETWLAKTALRRSKAASLTFMRSAWSRVDLDGIDTVVASSHAMAHHLAGRAVREGRRGLAYVYSPPRYLWAPELDARGERFMARVGRRAFQHVDRRGLHPDVSYVAISEFVAQRMREAWGVESRVIYPPVETTRITSTADWKAAVDTREQEALADLPDEFILGASRLIEYKRLDVAMTVGQQLGMPVVIAGEGPYADQLRAHAQTLSVPVHFVGRVSDAALYALYQRAQLFVFMAVEDFGIMPIEAMALGTRALVRDVGGTSEVARLLGCATTADAEDLSDLTEKARMALESPPPDPGSVARAFSAESFRAQFAELVGAAPR